MPKNKYFPIFIAVLVILVATAFFVNKNKVNFPSKPICPGCNVLIVGYDTVGANHVSSLGYNRQTTPNLDFMASQGFSFINNISPAPWTVPSFMSLFTGLYPTEHKVINKFSIFTKDQQVVSNLKTLSPNTQTLAEVFKKNGYITGGFTGDAGVSSQFGYKDGFDVYTDEKKFGSIDNAAEHALDWLNENKGKKFLMFLHGYDAHAQFTLEENYKGAFMPTDYAGSFKGTAQEEAILREDQLTKKIDLTPEDVAFWIGRYDSQIKDGDARFGNFWSEFTKMGLDRNTIVIILSDHGEEFYEHGGIDHGHTLYDELVRVPLVIKIPGMAGGKKITDQVTTIDVAPTLFDILGIKPNQAYQSQIRGKSLLPLIQGQTRPRDIFTETDYRDFTHKRSIRTADGWKYILTMETQKRELYDLKTDPAEKTNAADQNPQTVLDLDKKLKDHIRAMGDNPDKDWLVGCLPVYVGECE